jgi:hypothetical protein
MSAPGRLRAVSLVIAAPTDAPGSAKIPGLSYRPFRRCFCTAALLKKIIRFHWAPNKNAPLSIGEIPTASHLFRNSTERSTAVMRL